MQLLTNVVQRYQKRISGPLMDRLAGGSVHDGSSHKSPRGERQRLSK